MKIEKAGWNANRGVIIGYANLWARARKHDILFLKGFKDRY